MFLFIIWKPIHFAHHAHQNTLLSSTHRLFEWRLEPNEIKTFAFSSIGGAPCTYRKIWWIVRVSGKPASLSIVILMPRKQVKCIPIWKSTNWNMTLQNDAADSCRAWHVAAAKTSNGLKEYHRYKILCYESTHAHALIAAKNGQTFVSTHANVWEISSIFSKCCI